MFLLSWLSGPAAGGLLAYWSHVRCEKIKTQNTFMRWKGLCRLVSLGWAVCRACAEVSSSPSACHLCMVLLRLRAVCEFPVTQEFSTRDCSLLFKRFCFNIFSTLEKWKVQVQSGRGFGVWIVLSFRIRNFQNADSVFQVSVLRPCYCRKWNVEMVFICQTKTTCRKTTYQKVSVAFPCHIQYRQWMISHTLLCRDVVS